MGRAYLEVCRGRYFLFSFQNRGIDRVELTTLLGVCEDLVSFLDALEEGIVVRILVDACKIERVGNDVRRRLLIRVMLEHLFPVCNILRKMTPSENFGRTCDLDLVFVGLVAEVRETKHCIVVLFLDGYW